MIKKISLCFLLVGIFNTSLYAEERQKTLIKQNEQQIQLKNLDFKTVMMAFYSKQIRHIVIPELESDKQQYVGANIDGEDAALIYLPPKTYQDQNNETRYLLTVSQVAVNKEDRTIIFCGICAVFTDVFIFEKNSKNQYQLISRTNSESSWSSDGFNYTPYEPESIIKDILQIGPNVKGYVEESFFSKQGYSTTTLMISPFSENPHLKLINVAVISDDNEATGSNETYSSTGKYRFLSSEHDGLYDIEIKYSGTQRADDSDRLKIVPKNEIHVYRYYKSKNEYVRLK